MESKGKMKVVIEVDPDKKVLKVSSEERIDKQMFVATLISLLVAQYQDLGTLGELMQSIRIAWHLKRDEKRDDMNEQ